MCHPRSLNDSNLAEVRALFERRAAAEMELKAHMQKIVDLKTELNELSDVEIGKDYKVSTHIIRKIRSGITYKQCNN